jgi:hypothetical protein
MISTDTPCRINGIHIAEITISTHINQPQAMGAIYALTDMESEGTTPHVRATHGKCTAGTNNWSKRTWDLLQELVASMEDDLLPQHFEQEESNVEPGSQPRELEEVGQI